jgi:hypothetical protein
MNTVTFRPETVSNVAVTDVVVVPAPSLIVGEPTVKVTVGSGGGRGLNVAVQLLAVFMLTVVGEVVPVQSPDHPEKSEP